MDPVAPLSFPPPPPAPSAPQRAASTASWKSVEPSVDDLQREIAQVKQDVSSIVEAVEELELLRDQVALSDLPGSESELIHPLKTLSSTTTTTGQRLFEISEPLTSISTRVDALAERAAEGRAAATTLEVQAVSEEVEVLKLGIKEAMTKVKVMAYGEVQGREVQRARLEERVRRENPGLGEDEVQTVCKQAMEGLNHRVSELDVQSEAGRLAAINPFTELAQLIDTAQQLHRSGSTSTMASESTVSPFSRLPSRAASMATTLVGSIRDPYGKTEAGMGEDGDLESQRLVGGGVGGEAGPEVHQGPLLKKWIYLRKNWRDVLVRTGIAVAVTATVVSIIVYEAIHRNETDPTDPSATANPAAAAWTGLVP